MSWWDDGDDVLGDGPADKLTAAWRTMLARRAREGRAPPSTEEALESFAAALRKSGMDPDFTKLTLWRGRDHVHDFTGAGGVTDLTDVLLAAFEPIEQDYRKQLERPPRSSELAKVFEFIVGPQPDAYLSDATKADWSTLRLRAG